MTQSRSNRRIQRLGIGTGTILLLALLGPFGTFSALGLADRFLYWGLAIISGYILFEALLAHVADRAPRRWLWGGLLLALLLASGLETMVVIVLERMLIGRTPEAAGGLGILYGYVLLLGATISALPLWLRLRATGVPLVWPSPVPSGPGTPTGSEQPTGDGRGLEGNRLEAGIGSPFPAAPGALRPERPDADARANSDANANADVDANADARANTGPFSASATIPFLRRIPARLGDTVLALEMEDHYVRIHTPLGSALILMRLRDAVEELAAMPGMQVHRSYWVAAAAVAGIEREPGGRLMLVLRNELRIPVSRSRAAAVRAAGWTGFD